jgi:dsDNA-specific endonuclease/ATPase MutS2
MRALLDHPAFSALPTEGQGELWHWQVLRLDRMLRWQERAVVDRLVRLIFEIDALVALADATVYHDFVMPEAHEGETEIIATDLYHPFLADPVANQLRVDQQQRLLFLTGPNMAGKTTYLRAAGIALYLAHLGMGVPAAAFQFTPCDCLFTAITLADNVRKGVSFFRAEALRVKAIAQAVANGRRVAALLDEPFMGTNVKDALDASRVVLTGLATKRNNVFLVSSHLIELGEALQATGSVECCHFEAGEEILRATYQAVSTSWTLPHLCWVRRHDPEAWARTRTVLVKAMPATRVLGHVVSTCRMAAVAACSQSSGFCSAHSACGAWVG